MTPAGRLASASGQALMLGVLILMVLLMAIPAIILLNQATTRHSVKSQNRITGRATAEEGIAYAVQDLSKSSKWPYLGGTLTSPGVVPGSNGKSFKLTYFPPPTVAPLPPLESYQVGVLSEALDPAGKVIAGSSVWAAISQKTLGVKLPTGQSVSAALQLMHTPLVAGVNNSEGLVVHWGPVALFENLPWVTREDLDKRKFPRKFTLGDLTGTDYGAGVLNPRSTGATPQDTDGKEYWANTSLGFPNVIDLAAYQSAAQAELGIPQPKLRSTMAAFLPTCPIAFPTCGYFVVPPGDAVVFDSGYALNLSTVVFINGNAELKDVNMDLKNAGALIVNGNLTLGPYGASGQLLPLRIPPTADREYPYVGTTPPTWPCMTSGSSCNSSVTKFGLGSTNGYNGGGLGSGRVQFRGFLYVTGNLDMLPADAGWMMAGAARVDGRVRIPWSGSGTYPALTIMYDDVINHKIVVRNLELQVDTMQAVP